MIALGCNISALLIHQPRIKVSFFVMCECIRVHGTLLKVDVERLLSLCSIHCSILLDHNLLRGIEDISEGQELKREDASVAIHIYFQIFCF